MKRGLLLVVATLFLCASLIPEQTIQKTLHSELKKQFKNGTYELKEIPAPEKYTSNGKFYEVISTQQNQVRYIYIGRVFTVRGSNNKTTQASGDYIDYYSLYNKDQTILIVKIFKLNSSHGEGVASAGWLKQFIGYNSSKQLIVGKNVDTISGATISVNNLTFDIQSKTRILKLLLNM